MKRIIEICANSAQSCVEAEAGGATRVELCAGIPEGGTTPSYGEIKTAKALTSKIDINVIIRPRGGDFLYTEAEVQSMLLDIELCKELKVHGVVDTGEGYCFFCPIIKVDIHYRADNL